MNDDEIAAALDAYREERWGDDAPMYSAEFPGDYVLMLVRTLGQTIDATDAALNDGEEASVRVAKSWLRGIHQILVGVRDVLVTAAPSDRGKTVSLDSLRKYREMLDEIIEAEEP